MEIRSLESQLSSIVDSAATRFKGVEPQAARPAPDSPEQDLAVSQVSDAVARELEIYQAHRDNGQEGEYLKKNADAMNLFFGEIKLDVKFKIEPSESGYIVSIVDDNGKVIKTIPSKEIVETRQRIREMIKGIFADKTR